APQRLKPPRFFPSLVIQQYVSAIAVAIALHVGVSARAQAPSPERPAITREEIDQGYSSRRFIAKTRSGISDVELAAAETRDGATLRLRVGANGEFRVLERADSETIQQAIERFRASGRYDLV